MAITFSLSNFYICIMDRAQTDFLFKIKPASQIYNSYSLVFY